MQYADGVTPDEGVRRVHDMLAGMVKAARVRDSLLPAHGDMHRLNDGTCCTSNRMMGGA